ncbi:MAG TPA: fatty acid desaturase [Gemmatimonadaceae bacterium]
MHASQLAPVKSSRSIQARAAAFRASSAGRASSQMITTFVPLAAAFALMFWGVAHAWWLTVLLLPVTALFFVRTFIIMHDCSHGSFTASRRANEIIGFITGVITLTPFAQWRRDHALHHASSGDLDRRGHGDVDTLTVDEYRSLNRWGRFRYRVYRNAFVMLFVGPIYLIAHHRLKPPADSPRTAKGPGVHVTNLAIVAMIGTLTWIVGWQAMLLAYAPVVYLASIMGIWLFYVQHQHDAAYWENHEEWDYVTAAMHGSSFYRLPAVLEWFTGSIGRHHVHHVDPRIPNYRLKAAHESVPEFRAVPVLTFRASLRTTSLKLWDPDQQKLVGFRAVRRAARRD